MNVDHLINLPDKISGHVVSVEGESITIKPADSFGARRYVGHAAEVRPQGTVVKVGYEVKFLPGAPLKRGKQPRAYEIEITKKQDSHVV